MSQSGPLLAATPNTVAFTLDGAAQRFVIADPGHATINRLSSPPVVAIVARAEGSSETLIVKLGIDLDRATLPLTLRALEAGGPTVSFTYVDATGARSTGQIDQSSSNDHLTLEAWSSEDARLRARFTATLTGPASTHTLTQGSLDVALHDPLARR